MDFEKLNILVDYLSIFHCYIMLFNKVYYPNIHLMLHALVHITLLFKKYSNINFLKYLIFKMISKFLKYYDLIPSLVFATSILNRRIKGCKLLASFKIFYDFYNSY